MAPSQSRQFGRTINLYLVDGSPNGVIVAEIGVSTTKAVMASRTSLPQLLARDETGRTGIYILVGPDPDQNSRDLVYVGEGDQVKTRLAQHDKDENKDFFTKVVVLISKDDNLTKAHGRYIESRLIAALRSAGRVKLANATQPDFAGLPEPQIANMERMLEEIEILLPVLGFNFLSPQESITPTITMSGEERAPVFVYSGGGFNAEATEIGGEFVVRAGALVRQKETETCPEGARALRKSALDAGHFEPSTDGISWKLKVDQFFGSPSGAASFVYGGSANGHKYWKVKNSNTTYGEWREKLIVGQVNTTIILQANATAEATTTLD
jgi:hypothetical protein